MAPIGKFSGVAKTSISRVDNILAASISGIDNINLALGPVLPPGTLIPIKRYDFENQTNPNTDPNTPWVPVIETALNIDSDPSTSAWYNGFGIPAFGGAFDDIADTNIVGWNLNVGQTNSSYTGPSIGGANSIYEGTDSTIPQVFDSQYIYAETSNPNSSTSTIFSCQFIFSDIVSLLQNPANDFKLHFYVHASSEPGANEIGNLYIYTNSKTDGSFSELYTFNHDDLTLATTLPGDVLNDQFPNTSVSGDGTDPWLKIEVDLTYLKVVEQTNSELVNHSVHFIYGLHGGYYGDLCLDNVGLYEVVV